MRFLVPLRDEISGTLTTFLGSTSFVHTSIYITKFFGLSLDAFHISKSLCLCMANSHPFVGQRDAGYWESQTLAPEAALFGEVKS